MDVKLKMRGSNNGKASVFVERSSLSQAKRLFVADALRCSTKVANSTAKGRLRAEATRCFCKENTRGINNCNEKSPSREIRQVV